MQQILIIEDDRALNQGLCKALKTDNNSMQVCSGLYASATDRQIVSCENLKDAKEQLLCGMPALILLDINLPDGSGLDFLHIFCQSPNAAPDANRLLPKSPLPLMVS